MATSRAEAPEGPTMARLQRMVLLASLGFTISLSLGVAAALAEIPHTLALAAALAMVCGLASIPSFVLLLLEKYELLRRQSFLLLVALVAGVGSLFVGGAVGPDEPLTLLGGLIALVVYLYVGHERGEATETRVRRLHFWSMRTVLLGLLALLLALLLFVAYVSVIPAAPASPGDYPHSLDIAPGSSLAGPPITAGAGVELCVYVASNDSTADLNLTVLLEGPSGSTPLEVYGPNDTGGFGDPTGVCASVGTSQELAGSYHLDLSYGPGPGAPTSVEMAWRFVILSTPVVLSGAGALGFLWTGLIAFTLGGVLWFMTRPPKGGAPDAAPSKEEGTGDPLPSQVSDNPAPETPPAPADEA